MTNLFLNLKHSSFVLICLVFLNLLSDRLICSFHIQPSPLRVLNLVDYENNEAGGFGFAYPAMVDSNEKLRVLEVNQDGNFILLGASESIWPLNNEFQNRDCSSRFCANYILTALPLTQSPYSNYLICGTYFGTSKCIESKIDQLNGHIVSFDASSLSNAPKFVSQPINSENAYYLSKNSAYDERVLYTASSWTDNSQYLAAYSSHNAYKNARPFKLIGKSKSFVKFIETDEKLFLFQNEDSYDVDDGETSRDILISTSLVSQVCKNDDGAANTFESDAFYSELTAKIYCFKDAFRSDSGNSENFKFDSLKFVTDFMSFDINSQPKKLFYGVFNTPEYLQLCQQKSQRKIIVKLCSWLYFKEQGLNFKNQITASAICFFDINDIISVFQKQNFKYLDEKNKKIQSAKDSSLNPQQCPNLNENEKSEYRLFTSRLSLMSRAALPVRRRKASFITTNSFRINCLLTVHNKIHPVVRKKNNFQHLNIILAGTNNGKLMRIAHHFSDDYFETDSESEESVQILEEIQLFDKNTPITKIEVLKSENKEIILAIAHNQIKTVRADFCELYKESCEKCTEANSEVNFVSDCNWSEGKCRSSSNMTFNEQLNAINSVSKCDLLRATTSTVISTTTTTTTSATTTTFTKSIIAPILQIFQNLTNNQPLVTRTLQLKSLVSNNHEKDRFVYSKNSTTGKLESNLNTNFIITFSISISLLALVIGIIFGYMLKAKYSKKLLKSFESMFKRAEEMDKKPSHLNPYEVSKLNSEASKVRIARSFNCHEYKPAIISKLKSDESSINSSYEIKNDKSKRNSLIPSEYFQIAKNNLSSSDSSKTTTTTTTTTNSYGILNLINSQTCLLNRETLKSSNYETTVSESLNSSLSANRLILSVDKAPVNNTLFILNKDSFPHNDDLNKIKQNSYSSSSSTSSKTATSSSNESNTSSLADDYNTKVKRVGSDLDSSLGQKYSIRLAAQLNSTNNQKNKANVYIYPASLLGERALANKKEILHLNNSYV